jgi:hypothetical protein
MIIWCLLIVGLALCAYAQNPNAKQSSKPQAGSGVVVSKFAGPPEGRVVSEYVDERTGRSVFVLGSTEKELVAKWLRAVNSAAGESELGTLVSTDHQGGLIGATMYSDSGHYKVLVSWGTIEEYTPPGVVMTMRDERSGWTVTVASNAPTEQYKTWLSELKGIASADLVKANGESGLLAVTQFSSVGEGLSATVRTFWIR